MSETPLGAVPPGIVGKLPSRGDFIVRRLDPQFCDAWDTWLQQAIAESHRQLEDDWLECYLTGPLWSFALSNQVVSDRAYIGVMMPSVDKVGRYFPLTVAMEISPDADLLSTFLHNSDWFDRVEELLLDVLEDSETDVLELLEDSLLALAPPHQPTVDRAALSLADTIVSESTTLEAQVSGLALCAPTLSGNSFWRTTGSVNIAPSFVRAQGLPSYEKFSAMFHGSWEPFGWQQIEPMAALAAESYEEQVICNSWGGSHPGSVRSVNEDRIMLDDQNKVWVVADGVGGHAAGEVASSILVSSLQDLPLLELPDKVAVVRDRVNTAHTNMIVFGEHVESVIGFASTIVAFVMGQGNEYACLWAGDSRLYRLREGVFEQMTTDHSLDSEGEDTGVITRAVGAGDDLELDHYSGVAVAGDRYLLCSDGLYRALDEDVISSTLRKFSTVDAGMRLIEYALEEGAPDNTSVIILNCTS